MSAHEEDVDAKAFIREIPSEFQIVVDRRIYEAKLNDSYNLSQIARHLYNAANAANNKGPEQTQWETFVAHCENNEGVMQLQYNASTAIVEMLKRGCEMERAVIDIQTIIDQALS